MKKYIILGVILLVSLSLSYFNAGKRENPKVENQVKWNHAKTKELFYRACADCHSNETKWPWYSNFAPVSWLIINHVDEGREHFNISDKVMGDADEAVEEYEKGSMPPKDYLMLHPEAQFSKEEKAMLFKESILKPLVVPPYSSNAEMETLLNLSSQEKREKLTKIR